MKNSISQGKLTVAAYVVLFQFLLWTIYKQSKTFTTSEVVYVPVEISIKGQQPL